MQAAITIEANFAGKTVEKSVTITSDGGIVRDPTIAAAKTGTLTTRASGTAGTLTMTTGHGFTTGVRVHLYWSGGSCEIPVLGTVSTNSCPFTGAVGDALPVVDTAITAMIPQSENMVIATPADIVGISVSCNVPARATFRDNGPTDVLRAQVTDDSDYLWDGTGDNDLADESDPIATVHLSHGDAENARQVNCVVMTN